MPYITQERRDELARSADPLSAGELNFIFSSFAKAYWDRHGHTYRTGNDIMGAFDCAAKEFYRRVLVPHEKDAIRRNGDLYD